MTTPQEPAMGVKNGQLPPTASNDVERAFDLGWLLASKWAERDDLPSDMDSPAYQRGRAEALAFVTRAALPHMQPAGEAVVELPLSVFSEGEWKYSETGQTFSAADLDAAAFAVYRQALTTPPQPSAEEAQEAVATHCQNGRADVCLAGQHDGVVCPGDSCDIDDGVRATQPAPVDVRVVDEPMVVRALNAMVPGSDLGDAFGRWNVASFIACNEAPFTEVSRHDVMRAALKAALLSAQPSADAGDCLRDAIVGVVLAHKDDDEIDPDAFVDELLAAIAAQREAASA